ncbi:MAG: PAS domain-containing protein, partial [Planctomycetales bacterium]|nr:PAS domain-containing protein [Planctomycetales bacterium]
MNDQGPRSDFANSPLGVHLTLSLEAAWVLVPSSQAGIVGPEIDWENEVARKTFPAPPDAAPRPGHDPAPSHWLELWHVDDQADVLRAWQRVADTGQHEDTGQSIDASARVRIRAAEPRTDVHSRSDWELTFTTIASGQVVAVARDVTRDVATQAKLDEATAVYQSLVISLPINVFRKDRDGRFVFANPQFCATVGRTLDELLNRTDFDLFPWALADKY